MGTMKDWLQADVEHRRLFAQERLIADAAEEIYVAMERGGGTTRAALADRLGKSKAFVTQILSGSRNLTLRTLADIAEALGQRVELRLRPQAESSQWRPMPGPQVVALKQPSVAYRYQPGPGATLEADKAA
jgi:plasmid maintenance system antidote protein VapI